MKRILLALFLLALAQPAWATFPTISDSATSFNSSDTTSHTVTMPTTCASGKLLLVLFSTDGTESVTWPGSWAEASQSSGLNPTLAVGYLQSTGAEAGGNITVTTGTVEQMRAVALCIDNAIAVATQPPETSTYANDATNNQPDPPSLTPTGGAKDYLWIVFSNHKDGAKTVNTWPTNFSSNQITTQSGDSTTSRSAMATYSFNASSMDPSAFTWSGATGLNSNAVTIAIHPASSGSGVVPAAPIFFQ